MIKSVLLPGNQFSTNIAYLTWIIDTYICITGNTESTQKWLSLSLKKSKIGSEMKVLQNSYHQVYKNLKLVRKWNYLVITKYTKI